MIRKPVDNSPEAVNARAIRSLRKEVREIKKEIHGYIEILEEIRMAGRMAARIAGVLIAIGSFLLVYKNLIFGSASLSSLFGNKSS